MTLFHFDPVFGSYLLVLTAALILLVPLAWAPRFRSIAPRRRNVLVGLRVLVVLLVIVAMLRPTWVYTQINRQSAVLLLLLDRSRSMQVADAGDGRTRWQALRASVLAALPELRDLSKEIEVKVFTFAEKANPVPWDGTSMKLPETPDGNQTNLGGSLRDAVRKELGKRLLGAVLLSDGAPRVYSTNVRTQEVAREMARQGNPLYAVSFGLPREKSQASDVQVENLPDHFSAFVKNELEIRAQLRVRGYVNNNLPVELIVEDSRGNTEIVDTTSLRAAEDGQRLAVHLGYVPQSPGQYRLTVRAKDQPGELVTTNNELTAFLDVREGGLRVAYLYGESPFEPKFLRHAISESPDIQLDSQSVPHGFRDNWPLNLSKFLGEGDDYDVYILHSVHADAIGRKNLQRLVRQVGSGKGLMMVGGIYSFGPGRYQRTPLADVLPIVMDRLVRQDFDAVVNRGLHLTDRKMIPTLPFPVTHLTAESDNVAAWQKLPPLDFANRFYRIKPDGMIVAASHKDEPLLVAGQYDLGRVLAFAGDSTWRWRMNGWVDEHKRFWRQSILWLARRDEPERGEVWIRLAQHRYPPEGRVEFTAGALSREGDPVSGAEITAELVTSEGHRHTLQLARDQDHHAGSLTAASQPGEFAIEITAHLAGQPLGTTRDRFVVFDLDLELNDPAANPSLMDQMASTTSESGGRSLAAEELPALLKEIKSNLDELKIEIQTTKQMADSGWDAWLFFGCVVTLLGSEWFLRKKWGLV